MSIQEIEKRITEDAQAEASKILKEAEADLRQFEKAHSQKKEEVRAEILRESRSKAEDAKRAHLVPARLKARKAVLEEKQKILKEIYAEIQKEKNLSAAEIAKVREETEVAAANILFGD
jgi:V/A-type H+-transporting ATPase subunit E